MSNPTLESIAETLSTRGFYSKQAMKRGRRWRKADHDALTRLMENRGIPKEETDEYYAARRELFVQIEWLASCNEDLPY